MTYLSAAYLLSFPVLTLAVPHPFVAALRDFIAFSSLLPTETRVVLLPAAHPPAVPVSECAAHPSDDTGFDLETTILTRCTPQKSRRCFERGIRISSCRQFTRIFTFDAASST
ncbi:hypothetical protein QBC36DRAFT_47534 [Triangularia setosa]|uniref:Secreted protein n=1 Tax=Triangularia setosa TaxID=2587417 RepID=A0AAN7A3K2_9PEZI|nr:hypothetical protein QBC36DRAFT_47534 [Podospora setosa]